MKKTIIAIFAMAFATILPAKISAEDTKEYNMVITLQNGTTITLGHNDIKNITFNGEEISIEGNAVNSIEENKMRIDELTQMLNDFQAYTEDRLNQERYRTDEDIAMMRTEMENDINAAWGRIEAAEAELKNIVSMQQDDISAIQSYIAAVRASIDDVYNQLKDYVDMLMGESNELRTIVATLESRIAALENQK